MEILKNHTIGEIKKQFTSLYPGLKLEFYKKEHQNYEGSQKKDQYNDQTLISEIAADYKDVKIDSGESRTTKELEQDFENLFGLHIQVFRRSNQLWLQTSSTDDWTLEVQNRKGLHSVQ